MNAVKNTTFSAEFPVFTGSFRNSKFLGYAKVSGIITIDCCYSTDSHKHWIYFVVTHSDSPDYVIGKQYKKQGKNFYPAIKIFEYAPDYEQNAFFKKEYKEFELNKARSGK